jgi:hypothetical protein
VRRAPRGPRRRALQRAESAHLVDDRFRPFGVLGERHCIGDDRRVGRGTGYRCRSPGGNRSGLGCHVSRLFVVVSHHEVTELAELARPASAATTAAAERSCYAGVMKLYVCYGFLKNVRTTGRPGGHPCGNAHKALKDAGYQPEIEAVHGLGLAPFNRTEGRRKIKEMTGSTWVPARETDTGDLISDSKRIIAWAKDHPASAGL